MNQKVKILNIDKFVHPKVSYTIVSWTDLLGFGRALDKLKWDLTTYEPHYKTIKRLDVFHETAKRLAKPGKIFFALNDGLGINSDIEEEPIHLPTLFSNLFDLCYAHYRLNENDRQKIKSPGVRTVIVAGQRLIDSRWIEEISNEPGGYDTWRKPIGCRTELFRKPEKPIVYYKPRQFQLNLAFSKAYFLNELGSQIGLSGTNLYIEGSVVKLLIRKLNGSLRSKPDVWEYSVIFKQRKKIMEIILKQFENMRCKIILEKVFENKKIDDRKWGTITVYKLKSIYNPYSDPYLPQKIKLN